LRQRRQVAGRRQAALRPAAQGGRLAGGLARGGGAQAARREDRVGGALRQRHGQQARAGGGQRERLGGQVVLVADRGSRRRQAGADRLVRSVGRAGHRRRQGHGQDA